MEKTSGEWEGTVPFRWPKECSWGEYWWQHNGDAYDGSDTTDEGTGVVVMRIAMEKWSVSRLWWVASPPYSLHF